MIHRIEILTSPRHEEPVGRHLLERIRLLGNVSLESLRAVSVYSFDAGALGRDNGGRGSDGLGSNGLDEAALRALGSELFTDPVLHETLVNGEVLARGEFDWYVEVGFRPGVTDNVGRTAQESLEYRLGRPLAPGYHVHSATGYLLRGGLTREQVEALASEWLGNDLIQQHLVLGAGDLEKAGTRERLFHIPRVELNTEPRVESFDLETARDVLELSEQRLLALSPEEAGIILEYYSRPGTREKRAEFGLGGRATDVELEVIAQTWSEHCKHKIFNAEVEYTDEEAGTPPEHISSLFKTYIRGATARVRADKGADDICLSVFTDNAGVIRFDENWGLVLKVETHNSPSALDPYGGALTGIVGVNRDPFGTGRGAELLFNTDVFCFASPFYDQPLPPRLLHPRRIYEGVRLGVEHGGNKSGIPTINGSLSFHERFVGKPLVFCGTGGLLPAELAGRPGHEKWINPGDKVVMVGGRIGADGIHGATFSSLELNENSPVTAVQIGDPITQRKMFDFLLLARERNLYNAITDNGAGGLSSSVGEMAQMSGGAVLHLDRAPLKYPGLQPWEIFISEAQERMSLAVPPEKVEEFLRLSREMDVESTVLGEFTDSGFLQATFAGKTVALLDMEFLHEGLPPMRLKARWRPPASQPVSLPALDGAGLTGLLRRVLGRLNVCSKESVVRQYDHEVKGASVVKPLVGASDDGPSDAAVVRPVLDSFRGVALAHGICPRYSDLDTYHMSALAVDEAVRGLVAVGADPDNMAGLDNFCWCDPLPSPTNPEAEYKMAQLVRSVRALYDTCLAYGIPLISGKDSMKNDYVHSGVRISIPPTLLFTAAGLLEDVRQAVTMDAKAPGDLVYLLGDTRAELGGSEALEELGLNPPGALAGQVPRLTDPPAALRLYRALHGAIRSGLVRAAHDCSDGGLAVALAETAFAGALGLSLELGPLAAAEGLTALELLFSESPARLVVMIPPGYKEPFERAFAGLPCHLLGQVTAEPVLRARGGGELWLEAALADLKSSWQATLKDM